MDWMKLILMTFLMTLLSCQTQEKEAVTTKNTTEIVKEEKVQPDKNKEADILCDMDICLQLRNHDKSNKSFEIYKNSV